MDNIEVIKTALEIGKPAIEALFKTFVTPKIEELKKYYQGVQYESILTNGNIESKFNEYLEQTYKKCLIINTVIFPNQQIKIEELYYPLTINTTKNNQTEPYTIDSFNKKIFLKYEKILISDSAGMGKSTMIKWLCLSAIKEHAGIPILIELRKLNDKHTILDEIYNQFNPIGDTFDKNLILKFLELGEFIILLDGYDEIANDVQEQVTHDLRDFINKTNKNFFVLTSRPESSLSSFGDFQGFNIQPLEIEESYALINKYDNIGKTNISEQLINDIETTKESIQDFLKNPFLVSLLYRTYLHNKDIPSKKTTFYNELYAALYKAHDLSKNGYKRNKKSKLDYEDFREVLRRLAFNTAKLGKVEYTENELLSFIKKTKTQCIGLEFKENDFYDDLLLSVPLFVRDGNNIKWAHKSIQDYFVADFINCSSQKEEILTKIYDSQQTKYINILHLYYELDYPTFRKIIIYKISKDFINYCDTSYAQCHLIKKSDIKARQEKHFFIEKGGIYYSPNEFLGFGEDQDLISKLFPTIEYNVGTSTRGLLQIYKFNNFKIGLIEIISENNSAIIKEQSMPGDNFNPDLNFLEPQLKSPIILDDSATSILNKHDNYNKATDLISMRINYIKHFQEDVYITLNYQECSNLVQKIEKENITASDILDEI